jgi:hypothetical protein
LDQFEILFIVANENIAQNLSTADEGHDPGDPHSLSGAHLFMGSTISGMYLLLVRDFHVLNDILSIYLKTAS